MIHYPAMTSQFENRPDSLCRAARERRVVRTVVFLCLILAVAPLCGQTGLSTIRGVVADATGAVVAGAVVEIVDVLTNVRRETVSNDAGNFELPELKPGAYRL